MNINDKQNILDKLNQLGKLDLDAILQEKYPNESDASTIVIGNYDANELLSIIRRIVKQLQAELTEGLSILLPNTMNLGEYGNVNLANDINNLFTWLNTKDFGSAATIIGRIAYYQVVNGFWNKQSYESDITIQNNISQNADRLNSIRKKLDGAIEENKNLVAKYETDIKNLEKYIADKKTEFQTLSTNQTTSSQLVNEIQALLTAATSSNTSLDNIVKNQNEKFEELKKKQEEEQKKFNDTKASFDAFSEIIKATISDGNKFLSEGQEKVNAFNKLDEYLGSKKTEIEKLAGFAADSSLGHSFNDRQDGIVKSVHRWTWAIVFVGILSILWVVLQGNIPNLKPNTGNVWLDLFLYILRSSPALLLLGFVLKQYTKERNLEEEYAFKKAIAVTINAYADQLEGETDGDRRALIKATVEKIYKEPFIYSEKGSHIGVLGRKGLKEVNSKVDKILEMAPKIIDKLK